MLEIKDRNFFLEIAADAVVQAKLNLTDEKEITRWVNAIAKGVKLAEDRSDFITYMPDDKSLVIWSDSDEVYAANGVCQCKAYTTGIAQRNKPYPCKHRALARIVRLYFELQEKPPRQTAASAAAPQAQTVFNIAPDAPVVDITEAPYLKPDSGKKLETLAGVRF